MPTPAFSLPSFAKINWNLRILGKRPDGYHEVRTFLQTISLQDQLHFESRDDDHISLACDNPNIPTDETNLIVRAANSLRSRYGVKSGASIALNKRIPAKGGLGGASSNAAIALMGLIRLWRLELNSSDLVDIAAGLGADVPFFLFGGCALGTGTGTTISLMPDAGKKYVLVVTPSAQVSTVEAYRALDSAALTTKVPKSILPVSHDELFFGDLDQWAVSEKLENDFERVIFDREPEIERAKNALLKAGATGALLAGSGSSVFGIFEGLEAQTRASGEILVEAGWRIFPCVTIARNEYSRAVKSPGSQRSF